MRLSDLIKGSRVSATATHATVATLTTNIGSTVASVATVAVAIPPNETIKRSTGVLPPANQLYPSEEKAIRAWLDFIGEQNLSQIAEVLKQCEEDPSALRYFMDRSKEAPPAQPIYPIQVTCGECYHFKRIDHPNLGHCQIGKQEAIAGLWDNDKRHCNQLIDNEVNSQ